MMIREHAIIVDNNVIILFWILLRNIPTLKFFPPFQLPIDIIVGRLSQKSCTLGCKHETWYNYSLRNSKKNWKGTQVVSRPYD